MAQPQVSKALKIRTVSPRRPSPETESARANLTVCPVNSESVAKSESQLKSVSGRVQVPPVRSGLVGPGQPVRARAGVEGRANGRHRDRHSLSQ